MKNLKKVLMISMVMAFVLLLGACDRNVSILEEVKNKDELAYGVTGANEPFNFEDESGERVGFDVDIANEIASRLEVEAKAVETDEEAILTDLVASEHDIVVGVVPVTEDTELQVDFTQPYYLDSMSDKDDLKDGQEMAIATKKSDSQFLNEVDGVLEDMIEDGTYGDLTEKWFDEDMTDEIKNKE